MIQQRPPANRSWEIGAFLAIVCGGTAVGIGIGGAVSAGVSVAR